MSRNVVITIVVVLVVIAAGWYLMRPKQPAAPATVTVESTPAPASSESSAPSAASSGAMMKETVVNISSSGFSPKAVTIKVGDSVTWMNTDSLDHTVNSAVHPTHLVYPPLNLGNIQPGGKVSLTFPTVGTYKYHDHLNPSLTGSVVVQ